MIGAVEDCETAMCKRLEYNYQRLRKKLPLVLYQLNYNMTSRWEEYDGKFSLTWLLMSEVHTCLSSF